MAKPQIVKFRFPQCLNDMPLGPSAEAGILTESNAGWRVQRPVIDHGKCTKCLMCWVLCPEGVIDKEPEKLEIDMNYCKGCGLCAHECPKGAVTMIREGDFHDR
ncbi:MAG: 4Fe-4S binding protein [Deltaproteobacteria bacterium]|nr:4Fe-4S binding protein [Deltaproteobacteria bacterium]